MAPEQVQSCIDACNLCAEACEQQLRATPDPASSSDEEAMWRLLRDCAALCRLTAGSLAEFSDAAGLLCAACAQVCRLCANQDGEPASMAGANSGDQLVRACLHCAAECERLSAGLPPATALA